MESQDAEFLPMSTPGKEERTWAMLCHLCIVAQIFVPILILGPLIIWLVKSDQLPFLKTQGKEVLNFQITLFLAGLIGTALIVVGVGILVLILLWIYSIVAGVIGAVKVNEGVSYRYTLNLRLIG